MAPRMDYIDYLVPLQDVKGAIYISSNSVEFAYDIWTYFRPFDKSSWLVIFSILVGLTIVLGIFSKSSPISTFYDLFRTIFGGDMKEIIKKKRIAHKIIALTCLFMGSLIWTFYQAQVTSYLTIKTEKMPFQDLES